MVALMNDEEGYTFAEIADRLVWDEGAEKVSVRNL